MTDNWNITGHEWAVKMLRQHITRGQMRHAYLFSGAPGLGRRTLALRFAQALNCSEPPAPGEICGTCRNCRQIAAQQHPDMSFIQADHEGGTLKVEQVREVQRSLSLKPYQSAYRVAFFLRFQEANANAANALLKTLEEAPPHVVLLLTADSPEQLLPTILSRCEILRLRPLSPALVTQFLQAREVEPEQARLLGHLSGGRPGYALRLHQHPEMLSTRAERLDALFMLVRASHSAKFKYAEKMAKDKEAMRATLLIWLSCWRDVMLCAAGNDATLINVDYQAQIRALAHSMELASARRTVSALEQAIERLEKNVNARLLGENVLMDLPKG
jgi:DNA polymerase III subunit delta'